MDRFDFRHTFDSKGVALRVTTRTRGGHEAGRMNGPPERCREAEGETETTITGLAICIDGKEFPLDAADPLFERLAAFLEDDADMEAEAKLDRDWHKLASDARSERAAEEAEGRME